MPPLKNINSSSSLPNSIFQKYISKKAKFRITSHLKNPKTVISLLILLFLIIGLIITAQVVKTPPDVQKKKAAEKKELDKPTFVPSQVIVKFKSNTGYLKLQPKATSAGKQLNSNKPFLYSEFQQPSLPQAIKDINQLYPVHSIEKVAKDMPPPEQRIQRLQQITSSADDAKKQIIDDQIKNLRDSQIRIQKQKISGTKPTDLSNIYLIKVQSNNVSDNNNPQSTAVKWINKANLEKLTAESDSHTDSPSFSPEEIEENIKTHHQDS